MQAHDSTQAGLRHMAEHTQNADTWQGSGTHPRARVRHQVASEMNTSSIMPF